MFYVGRVEWTRTADTFRSQLRGQGVAQLANVFHWGTVQKYNNIKYKIK